MHDRVRRYLCRVFFLAASVLPTALVCGWVALHLIPGRLSAEQDRLSSLLQMQVEIDSYENKQPGIYTYENLTLANLETGRQYASLGKLALIASGKRYQLKADQGRFSGKGLAAVIQLLHARLQIPASPAVEIDWRNCVIDQHHDAQPYNIVGRFEPSPQLSQLTLALLPVESRNAKPLTVHVRRDRSASQPVTCWQVDTQGEALPCVWFASLLPQGLPCGTDCRFRGQVVVRQTQTGLSGEFSGEFENVEIGQLCRNAAGFDSLTGSAHLTVQEAKFADNRLETITASVVITQGEIPRAAIEAAIRSARCIPTANISVLDEKIPFVEIAFSFRLDGQGLALQGTCVEPSSGILLTTRWGDLLHEPRHPYLTANDTMQVLLAVCGGQERTNGLIFPLSQETEYLARLMPYPSSEPGRLHAAETPHNTPPQNALPQSPAMKHLQPRRPVPKTAGRFEEGSAGRYR